MTRLQKPFPSIKVKEGTKKKWKGRLPGCPAVKQVYSLIIRATSQCLFY